MEQKEKTTSNLDEFIKYLNSKTQSGEWMTIQDYVKSNQTKQN